MSPASVVESFDVFEDRVRQLETSAPALPVEQFCLYPAPECLGDGVVVGLIGDGAQRGHDGAQRGQQARPAGAFSEGQIFWRNRVTPLPLIQMQRPRRSASICPWQPGRASGCGLPKDSAWASQIETLGLSSITLCASGAPHGRPRFRVHGTPLAGLPEVDLADFMASTECPLFLNKGEM
jgi:hypothetical protein